jgi:mono/diheme cytochrome c family protein
MSRWRQSAAGWSGVAALLAAAFWLVLAESGNTQERPQPSPDRGFEIAQRFCKGCHLVDAGDGATLPAGVPTFRGIANRPGQTGQRIVNTLIRPHAPMPDIRLSSEEIGHILAYLETLRMDKSIPPLLDTVPQGPKPRYPAPS